MSHQKNPRSLVAAFFPSAGDFEANGLGTRQAADQATNGFPIGRGMQAHSAGVVHAVVNRCVTRLHKVHMVKRLIGTIEDIRMLFQY